MGKVLSSLKVGVIAFVSLWETVVLIRGTLVSRRADKSFTFNLSRENWLRGLSWFAGRCLNEKPT